MSKKQKVSEKEVEKIASLSRLSLSKEELVTVSYTHLTLPTKRIE